MHCSPAAVFTRMSSQTDMLMMSCRVCDAGDTKTKSKTKFIRENLSWIHSLDPNVSLLSISRKSDMALCCFDGLPPWAKPEKMTIVDTRCWPKAISPLWPNSPQRCKHYMEEWPTDRPQRLQSEGQWFVQQPIRGVCVWSCECVCVRVEVHAIGVGWRAATVVNWTTQFRKGLKSDCHKG